MSHPKSIADRCKQLRTDRGLSQRDLGAALGKSQATIARWENGQLDADFAVLERLAEVLGTTCCELVGCAVKP